MKENRRQINKKQDKSRGFWGRFWILLRAYQTTIKKLFIFGALFEGLLLIGPYLLKLIIDEIVSFTPEKIEKILFLIFSMFILYLIEAVVEYFLDIKRIKIIAEAESDLSNIALKKMLDLSLGYHERENTGNKISKIQRGADKITDLLGNLLWDVGPTISQSFLTFIVLFYVDWRFGLVFLIFAPMFVILTFQANRKVFPLREKRHDDYEEAAGKMAQAIININTVKSFVQEKKEEAGHRSLVIDIKNRALKEFNILFGYNFKKGFVLDLGRLSILLLGVYLVWQGNITIGSLVFAITIAEKALLSLWRISRLYDRVMESSEAIDRLYYLGQEKSEIENRKNGIKPKNIEGMIEFKGVSFLYKEAKNKALDNVNLKINSGCFTALVGPSGGGKTTVARMIYRHYDPQKGEILLDDKKLKDYDLYTFRKFIAIVPQEVEIFNTSIKENIAYANSKASLQEVKAAARIANAEEFIKNLSHGYETLVGERGIKLSGGQRQRIGIARAILANPRILIFDEATSSLDSHSEKLIQEAMDKISKGRTMIVIAHRLSTIKKADKIIVLENGKVQEQGSHCELAKKKGGIYAKLLRLQELGDIE